MHELPITQSLLEISLRHAERFHAKRIVRLHLKIGQLSTVVDDSVQFYWDIIAEGTLAQGAALSFHRIPAQLECQQCHTIFPPGDEDFACPTCQSWEVKVLSGTEFELESIDIE